MWLELHLGAFLMLFVLIFGLFVGLFIIEYRNHKLPGMTAARMGFSMFRQIGERCSVVG